MSVVHLLQGYLDSHAEQEQQAFATLNDSILENLQKIDEEIVAKKINRHESYAIIPQFFFKKKNQRKNDSIQRDKQSNTRFQKQSDLKSNTESNTKDTSEHEFNDIELEVQKVARDRYIQKRKQLILSSDELDAIWDALLNSAAEPVIPEQERIDYDSFRYFVALCISDIQKRNEYFSSEIFSRFAPDHFGRISIPDYFNFVLRKGSLIENQLSLIRFDSDFDNILTTSEMTQFIESTMMGIESLRELKKDFKNIYLKTAIRKFIFMLDFQQRGKFHINDVLQSLVFQEFQEMHNEEMNEREKMSNWFTIQSTFSVYETFKQLNFSQSGYLSRNEMLSFNEGSLTRIFVERLMQEYVLHPTKKIDYDLFVDFILAYENKETPQAKRFFWKILDIYHVGYLTPLTVGMFFKEIIGKLKSQQGIDDYEMNDLIIELYSMVNPKAKDGRIYLQDFLDSKQGGTCMVLMIDSMAFYSYDTREQQSQDQ